MPLNPFTIPNPKAPRFPVDTAVMVLRPHLYAGRAGVVVSLDKAGIHRVKLPTQYEGQFEHTEMTGDYLEYEL